MILGGELDSQGDKPGDASDKFGRTFSAGARLCKLLEPIRKYVFAPYLCIVTLATGFVVASPFIAPHPSIILDPTSIHLDAGNAFLAPLPLSSMFPFQIMSDNFGYDGSALQLLENGQSLGPAHSLHELIRSDGKGRYSYWHGALWFSASDNSDPRTNGRRYAASAKAQLLPSIIYVALLLDLIFVGLFYRRVSSLVLRHRRSLGAALTLIPLTAAALAASGAFGIIKLNIAGPANSALVLNAVRHALIGCLLTLVQWASGAGVALAMLGDTRASFGRLALLGFPFSLILLAVFVLISLALPFGIIIGTGLLAASLLSLLRWRPQPSVVSRAGKVILAILPLALMFGCWLGLLAHGPTANLFGRPSGDVVYYASSISALQLHHFPIWYLGNEGEQYLPFNMLFPAVGAALSPYLRLDPFLFILAAGGSTYVLSLGIAVFSYLSTRANCRADNFSLAIAALAIVVAGRYPYWTVESIPVAFTLPLTIAIWFRVGESTTPFGVISNFGLSIVSAMLTKVTVAATMAPLALAPLVGGLRNLSKVTRIAGGLVIGIAALCGLAFVIKLGPLMIESAILGPESYANWQYGFSYDLPFILRDAGTIILVGLACRLSPWPIAASLSLGLTFALAFSFFLRINFACAALIIGLLFTETDRRMLDKMYAVAAFGLCLPAMLMTDFGGYPSGFFWLLCVGGATWIVLANPALPCEPERGFTAFGPALSIRSAAVVSLAAALCLIAVADGELVLNPSDRNAYLQISPDVRDIWLAVRRHTPRDALVFTDQTGPDPGLLTGWNTFALTGERQVYLAGWYQSVDLRVSPTRRAERLALNGDVLSGRLQPTDLRYSRAYQGYFAVVQRNRTMASAWKLLYANSGYALYHYIP